jgi:hypothetical protein
MRQVLIGFLLLMVSGVAFAQDYTSGEYCAPWCQGRFAGMLDCSYYTFDQCLATTRGLGTHCYENPFLHLCTRHVPPDRRLRRKR